MLLRELRYNPRVTPLTELVKVARPPTNHSIRSRSLTTTTTTTISRKHLTNHPRPSDSRYPKYSLSLMGLISITPIIYYFFPSSKAVDHQTLSPQYYSSQKIKSIERISPGHVLLSVPVTLESIPLFSQQAVRLDGSPVLSSSSSSSSSSTIPGQRVSTETQSDDGEGQDRLEKPTGTENVVVVQHVMIKSPDLQIERPYTILNNVSRDGEMRLLVKRNRGGEVGRLIHSKKDGDELGIRGPITTFSLIPENYDKIIMISTGTAIAPFIQLLSKLPHPPPPPPATSQTQQQQQRRQTRYHLIHSLPYIKHSDRPNSDPNTTSSDTDISLHPSLLPALKEKIGDQLEIHRYPPGEVPRDLIQGILKTDNTKSKNKAQERVLVLVCLPPLLMRPLCGGLTPTLQQGPLSGHLKSLGLDASQVWKLE